MRVFPVTLLWLAIVAGALAQGEVEPPSLTGTISRKGNAPFDYLCLTDLEGRLWRLTGSLDDLARWQGEVVTVEVVSLPARTPGPYPPAVEVIRIR